MPPRATTEAARPDDTLGTLTWIAVALGTALRGIAYVRRDILWLDEAAIARNLVERSLADLLLVPLDYGQAAPKGYLLLHWVVMQVVGTSDLAFRLVPFASSIASLLLFQRLARRLLSAAGALAAVLFFAVGYWFLVYSAELHPYGLDLALSLGALALAIDLRRDAFAPQRVWAFAAYGAVVVWFSNAVVLTLGGLGLALGAIAWREHGLRAALARLWPIALAWGVSAAGAVWVAMHSFFPRAKEFFAWAWQYGMVPLPRSPDAVLWLWNAWRTQLSLFHGWNVTDPAWTSLYVALALVGFLSLIVRRTGDAVLAGSVVAVFVLASMAKQYPYDARFLLVSIAVFILGIGESIGVLANASWGRAKVAARAIAVLLCVPPVYRLVAFPPPYQWTVTGSYLAQIRERWQPGDVVYTTYVRALEVLHSAPRFGISANDVIVGPCPFGEPEAALRAADRLRGRARAWVMVGTGYYAPNSPEYAYLRTIGVRRDSLPVRLPGTFRFSAPDPFDIPTAYLFDVSDPTRLGRATADSYTLSPILRRAMRSATTWNCYGVWAPLTRESDLVRRAEPATP